MSKEIGNPSSAKINKLSKGKAENKGMSKWSVLAYFMRLIMKLVPSYLVKTIVAAVFRSVTPFLNIFMVRFIIDELMGNQSSETLVMYVLIMVGGNFVLRIINKYFEVVLQIDIRKVYNSFDEYLANKCVEMDFEYIEDTKILDLKEKAQFAIHNLDAIGQTMGHIANLIYSFFVIAGLSYLLFVLNPLLILGMLVIVVVNAMIFRYVRKLEYRVNQESVSGNRAYMYYIRMTTDFSIAKDIRLYQGADMIVNRIKYFTDNLIRKYAEVYTKLGKFAGFTKINIQLQMVLIYGYLAYGVISGEVSIGEFTMYAGAVSSFSTTLSAMIEDLIGIGMNCDHLALFIDFDKLESSVDLGNESISQVQDMTIEFKNVSFSYPRKEELVLKKVNAVIKPGEKLSIVGLNGAGKTTFIKLLARLYQPTSGVITLGDIDINTLDYKEYMELLSIVFQDFQLLSYSIHDNLAKENLDYEGVTKSLEEAGFNKDLDKLEEGLDTLIYKNFDKKGVEFSGGQSQKIALARALYKDAPIVILDEPTSALDPVSEYEVYEGFNKMVQGKTAIYISHRLSSTRFSDRIAVFRDGEIVEYGGHEELLMQDGLYADMYQTQSKYYIQESVTI